MINLTKLKRALEIAERAEAYVAATLTAREKKLALNEAYEEHRSKTGLGDQHIDRNSPEWEDMMDAASFEYDASAKARGAAYAAKRRLIRAVQKGGAA